MIVEVLAVGTELLLGQIVNRNAATIGTAIAESGLDAHFQQVVGDNQARLEQAFTDALARADAVIVTGGIGPTRDDITREALAAVTGRPLRFSEEAAERLRERFASWGREMPESNLRQLWYPEGGALIPNPKGTAPAVHLEHDGRSVFLLPGVPEEMTALLTTEVMPRLRAKAGVATVLESRVLRSWGIAEAAVGETLDDLFEAASNPSLAFLASGGEIKIRITAKAADRADARRLIEPVEAEVRRRLGSAIFGADDVTIERVLADLLGSKGWTVGTAESATAGMVASRLASISGASEVFRGSVVAYAPDLKGSLLEVGSDVLAGGVVTEGVAAAMAEGARRTLGVDVAISTTGSAGPDPLEREVGTMVVGIAVPGETRARTLRLPGDRERVRVYGSTAALHLARLGVAGAWWGNG